MLKLLLSCVGMIVLSMAIEKPIYDLDKADQLFSEFIITHGKIYTNDEEKQKRFQIFQEALIHINHLNSVSESVLGITQFSDLTTEEFVSKYTGLRLPTRRQNDEELNCQAVITDANLNAKEAPNSLDWRDHNVVTAVKNQNTCNSCWTFSTTGTVEGQYALKTGKLISLSEQEVMDCVEIPFGGHCEGGGDMVAALNYLSMNQGGLQTESDYPYVGKDLKCHADSSKNVVKINGCINFHLTNEDKLKEALYKYGPLAIAVDATSWNYYGGSVFKECTYKKLNHAVLLVGYGTEGGKDYWLIKNSWGTVYGEGGYIKITRGNNACGLLNSASTVAVVA